MGEARAIAGKVWDDHVLMKLIATTPLHLTHHPTVRSAGYSCANEFEALLACKLISNSRELLCKLILALLVCKLVRECWENLCVGFLSL